MPFQETAFDVRGEFIPLDALLKATGLAPSGGVAKMMIADGLVSVDGQVETRKTCKIRAGQRVQMGEQCLLIRAAGDADAAA